MGCRGKNDAGKGILGVSQSFQFLREGTQGGIELHLPVELFFPAQGGLQLLEGTLLCLDAQVALDLITKGLPLSGRNRDKNPEHLLVKS